MCQENFPKRAVGRFENLLEKAVLIPLAGVVFTTLPTIGNPIETKHQGNYGRKKFTLTG